MRDHLGVELYWVVAHVSSQLLALRIGKCWRKLNLCFIRFSYPSLMFHLVTGCIKEQKTHIEVNKFVVLPRTISNSMEYIVDGFIVSDRLNLFTVNDKKKFLLKNLDDLIPVIPVSMILDIVGHYSCFIACATALYLQRY